MKRQSLRSGNYSVWFIHMKKADEPRAQAKIYTTRGRMKEAKNRMAEMGYTEPVVEYSIGRLSQIQDKPDVLKDLHIINEVWVDHNRYL